MAISSCGFAFSAVAKSVCNSVILPASMPCKVFCFVCFYQLALCRVCVFILWTSCLLSNKQRWALDWAWIGLDPDYEFCWIWIGSGL